VNATLMDNPFAIGDLVHIPQGTTLYKIINPNNSITMIYDRPIPVKISDKPTVGLIINKSIYDFYIVDVGNKEYMIKSDQMNYVEKGYNNAY